MNRTKKLWEKLQQQNRKALIPYFTVGYPSLHLALPIMHGLVDAGADIIEVGAPFSEPMAEGPIIQAAMESAIHQGVTLRQTLAVVTEFRKANQETPVVVMGYLNPIEYMGYEAFAKAAHASQIDAVIIVDLPVEESEGLRKALAQFDIAIIFLVSPTTTVKRMQLIAEYGQGFLYYVSLKGVTGSSQLNTQIVEEGIEKLRKITQLPIVVGFGIKTAEAAQEVAEFADGVVIGSALVSDLQAVSQDVKELPSSALNRIREIRKVMG
ncbi:MAG: tryptophan synthase subunit alpha [Proteobacteria bacterium]|nr:tryptophan synthase subunit alpha [Pseudomonadota bacterium]